MSVRNSKAEIVVAGLGCLVVVAHLAFWGAVIYVAIHFLKRLW